MNILVFTNLFPNERKLHHGIFVQERISQYRKFHHKTIVFSPVAYFPLLNFIKKTYTFKGPIHRQVLDGVTVYYYKYFHLPFIGMFFQPFFMFLFGLYYLALLHRQHKFDLIDAHYLYPDGVASYFFSKWMKVPFIQSARGSDVNVLLKFKIPKTMMKKSLYASYKIISVSEELKKQLVKEGISESLIKVIPNGVDSSKFYHRAKKFENSKNSLSCIKKILMVGNLIPLKGQSILIEALHLLKKQNLPFSLECLFIGSGTLEAYLKRQATLFDSEIQIKLISPVAHSRLIDYLNEADVLCLLSQSEGCPNVVLEALSCGLPVLTTDVGDLSNIIHNKIGKILPDRKPETVALYIKEMLIFHWDKNYIAEYSKRFDWEVVGYQIDKIFRESLKR